MHTQRRILGAFLLCSAVLVSSQDLDRELRLSQPRMNGPDVVALQNQLLSYGISTIGKADGWFGPLTEQAVRTYQSLFGFSQTGVVDMRLWQTVFSKDVVLQKVNNLLKTVIATDSGKYPHTERPLMGRSTEGGVILEYREKQSIKYYEVILTGEMGKVHYKVYPFESGYFILEIDYRYPQPFDLEHAEIGTKSYYYERRDTYMIEDGRVTKTNYDPIEILDSLRSK